MPRQLIIILSLFCVSQAYSQKNDQLKFFDPRKHAPTKAMEKLDRINHNCIKKNFTSFSNRLKNYPFNFSTEIKLCSFLGSEMITGKDTGYVPDKIPTLNDTVCYSKLKEVKSLTFKQVEELTNILYNYGFKGHTYTITEAGCYMPRNAILFLNNRNQTFGYIEICFECRKTRVSSSKMILGELCDQKIDMLKNFFKKSGIKYGVDTSF